MNKFIRILRIPDPVEAGDLPPTPPAPSTGDPPPAAVLVNLPGETENEKVLREQLEEEKRLRVKAETDASYHADEARRLKDAGLRPAPSVTVQGKSTMEKFFDGED